MFICVCPKCHLKKKISICAANNFGTLLNEAELQPQKAKEGVYYMAKKFIINPDIHQQTTVSIFCGCHFICLSKWFPFDQLALLPL